MGAQRRFVCVGGSLCACPLEPEHLYTSSQSHWDCQPPSGERWPLLKSSVTRNTSRPRVSLRASDLCLRLSVAIPWLILQFSFGVYAGTEHYVKEDQYLTEYLTEGFDALSFVLPVCVLKYSD